jgi:hypothetical protein
LSAAGCLRDDREGETVTEWGVMLDGRIASTREHRRWNESMSLDEAVDRWYPGAHVVTRQRTRFPDVVTDWSPVTPDGGDQS